MVMPNHPEIEIVGVKLEDLDDTVGSAFDEYDINQGTLA